MSEELIVVVNRPELKKDDAFQNAWFSKAPVSTTAERKMPPMSTTAERKISPMQQNFEDIKKYAYDAFDKLDTNQNGFIETEELYAAMQDEKTPMRDKSYIMFLLTNQADIAASAHEGGEQTNGISRVDLELYFRLVLGRLQE